MSVLADLLFRIDDEAPFIFSTDIEEVVRQSLILWAYSQGEENIMGETRYGMLSTRILRYTIAEVDTLEIREVVKSIVDSFDRIRVKEVLVSKKDIKTLDIFVRFDYLFTEKIIQFSVE